MLLLILSDDLPFGPGFNFVFSHRNGVGSPDAWTITQGLMSPVPTIASVTHEGQTLTITGKSN